MCQRVVRLLLKTLALIRDKKMAKGDVLEVEVPAYGCQADGLSIPTLTLRCLLLKAKVRF